MMDWLQNRTLRWQLSAALTGVIIASLAFVVLGTFCFVTWGEHRFLSSLSPEARREYAREWATTGMPSASIVREISLAEEQILGPVYEAELRVTILLSLVALGLGFPVARWAARRLTSPLETATDSARMIAQGEFGHRIQLPDNSPSEVASLIHSFTQMAASLERMEQDVHFSSASIAHEIRTPLTVLQGYLQGIRDGVFEADEQRLETMLVRIDALDRLLADLQTLSLAESGRMRLEKSSILLGERMRQLVECMDPCDHEITYVDEAPANLDRVIDVDLERIEQVVLGLLNNARRYAGHRARIQVRYRRFAEHVRIAVEDDGPGFSDQALERASQRFWRDESSRSRDTGGSGLGLAVAKAIVLAHGGKLKWRNRASRGASVCLTLPDDPASQDDAEPAPLPRPGPENPQRRG